ncbi:MAG: HD-GYP domain-containing protein [Ignavibacteriales bacterium]
MQKNQRNILHYIYLLALCLLSIWLTKKIFANMPIYPFSIILFTILNIIFGIREITVLDKGIERKYRYNFIFSIMCLILDGPATACIAALLAALIYLPFNQIKRIGKVDFPAFLLNICATIISLDIMAMTFFTLSGKIAEINFPINIFAILFGAAANYIANALIITIWIILGNPDKGFIKIVNKEFFWLIRYELWQAIYAILIINSYYAFRKDLLDNIARNMSEVIGIYDFLLLIGVITVAFIFYYPLEERRSAFNMLINYNRQNVDLLTLSKKLKQNNKRVIRAFMSMLEKRDPYTSGHSERVALYSKIIAKRLGFNDLKCEMLEMAAILHDIGKIGIDINILNKPDKLTDEEFEEIKKHPIYGVEILQKMYKGNTDTNDDEFKLICDIANSHHERYDGRGYPYGTSGEEITLDARIIAVADTLDAMTSDRSYRKGLEFEKAIEEIRKHSGTQFCPKVVNAFLECVNSGNLYVSKDEDVSKLLNIFS